MNYKSITIEHTQESPSYFTSDLHFFHNRIVDFTGRPTTFENLSEWIITQCNLKVKEESAKVFHLGDMFFKCTNEEAVEVLSKLRGNWYFILGNHDNPSKLETVVNTVNALKGTSHSVLGHYQEVLIKVPPVIKNTKHYKKQVILCHFPIEDWNARCRNSYMIHGHLHGSSSDHGGMTCQKLPHRFDVGIDNSHDFTPFSFDEIREIMKKTANGKQNPYGD